MLVEAEDHVAEQVGRRLVARHQQQAAEAEQLHGAQALPINRSGQQRAYQVVLWMLAALLQHLREVAIHALDLLEKRPALLFRQALIASNEGIRPAFEILAQLGRDAQQFGNDGHRQGIGQVAHHIHLTHCGDVVQQFVGDGGDARLQLRHHARRESLRDQVAKLAMAWRVHL